MSDLLTGIVTALPELIYACDETVTLSPAELTNQSTPACGPHHHLFIFFHH